MNVEEERRIKRLEREQATQTVVNAYHRAFRNQDGNVVLADLEAAFGINLPCFLPVGTRPGVQIAYDPLYAAVRDGQRQVYLHIMARLNVPPKGDADITQPKEVLTGLSQ
jgi:hypothetical protein